MVRRIGLPGEFFLDAVIIDQARALAIHHGDPTKEDWANPGKIDRKPSGASRMRNPISPCAGCSIRCSGSRLRPSRSGAVRWGNAVLQRKSPLAPDRR